MYNAKPTHLNVRSKAAAIVAALPLAVLLAGCSNSNTADLGPLRQTIQKQQDIILRSDGDWNKLSAADQQTLIKGPGYGSAQAAKAYLTAMYMHDTTRPTPGPPAWVQKRPRQ